MTRFRTDMTSRRALRSCCGFALLGVILGGCAGQGLRLSRAFERDETVQTVQTAPTPRDVELDERDERSTKTSPFLAPPRDGDIQQVSGQQMVAEKPMSSSRERTSSGPRHNSATLMLIEAEFRDATAQERAEWYEILRDVDPALVPQLLRTRRMMKDRAARNESTASMTSATSQPWSQEPPPSEFLSSPPPGPAAETIVQPRPPMSPLTTTATSPQTMSPQPRQTPPAVATAALQQPAVPQTSLQQPTTPTASPAATWPPNDQPVQQTGYVDMTAALPTTQTPQKPSEGQYPLTDDWQTQLTRLIGLLESDLTEPSSGDDNGLERTRKHAFLRMLYFMDGQQTRSLQAIPNVDPNHQEFWTQLFWGLTNYFDQQGIPDAGHRATETITQLRTAIERLKPEARLQLRNAVFSHKINSFGDYERFDRDEFRPGQPVLVYTEVQNFASEMDGEGQYKTRLRSSIEVHKAGRGPESGLVYSHDYPATEDVCRNRRQDYFHSYRVDLPDNLTPGPHTLKLMVEDEQSHRIATTTLSFLVK